MYFNLKAKDWFVLFQELTNPEEFVIFDPHVDRQAFQAAYSTSFLSFHGTLVTTVCAKLALSAVQSVPQSLLLQNLFMYPRVFLQATETL